ncbi:MAG: hypothetical protein K0R09_2303, partial [Clostridiales bacterium]|nr:hypothetical protein [Clostridiales bacterium]
ELLNNKDPYYSKKKLYNNKILEKYSYFENEIKCSANTLRKAVTLAIGGNIIDFSPKNNSIMDKSIENILNHELTTDNVDMLIEDLKKTSSILYLTDNAGEIVLDKLLIQTLIEYGIVERDRITVAVKGEPIINDATIEEAMEIGLTSIVRVIGNGDCTPGTALGLTSKEFKDVFNNAEVVISKGQGNFETLDYVQDKNIYFMLIAKCNIIASKFEVKIGSFICKNNKVI